jgi:methylthioribulose-1-phosphate dehydratase
LAQAVHQPLGETEKPANKLQAPLAALKNWQFEQALPGFLVGSFEVAASGKYLSALAVGLSAGSAFKAWAKACPIRGIAIARMAAWRIKRRRALAAVFMARLLVIRLVYSLLPALKVTWVKLTHSFLVSVKLIIMNDIPYDPKKLQARALELVETTRELAQRGWTPATSSNFSMRLDDKHAAITVSGRDKGRLTQADIMVVDLHGQAVATAQKPSAETLLHTHLYARYPEIGCVLHTHSINQTLASRIYAEQGFIQFEGYELIKALRGQTTHDTHYDLPIFANTQDMTVLAKQVEAKLDLGALCGYLINGHGLYAWGHDMMEARRHLEAFDFLITCELEMRKHKR